MFLQGKGVVNSIVIGGRAVCGCRLRKKGRKIQVLRAERKEYSDGAYSPALEEILRALGGGQDNIIIVAAALPGGTFFRMTTVKMPPRELAGALDFELGEHVLQLPDPYRMQFTSEPHPDPELVYANVSVLPTSAFEPIAAAFSATRNTLDDFLHPLLALDAQTAEEGIYLPDIEPEYYFQKQTFHENNEEPAVCFDRINQRLLDKYHNCVEVSERCRVEGRSFFFDYFTAVFVGNYVLNGAWHTQHLGLNIVPKLLRPRRLLMQFRIMALLLLLIVGLFAVDFLSRGNSFKNELDEVSGEVSSVQSEIDSLTRTQKARDKEYKEMARVLALRTGNANLLEYMARISELLPTDVLVSNMQWNENTLDMNLQTESDSFDESQFRRCLPGWKVANFTQRRMGDTLSILNVRLEREAVTEDNAK